MLHVYALQRKKCMRKMEAISVFIIRIVELWYALTVEY